MPIHTYDVNNIIILEMDIPPRKNILFDWDYYRHHHHPCYVECKNNGLN
jgi:hypothetical protein